MNKEISKMKKEFRKKSRKEMTRGFIFYLIGSIIVIISGISSVTTLYFDQVVHIFKYPMQITFYYIILCCSLSGMILLFAGEILISRDFKAYLKKQEQEKTFPDFDKIQKNEEIDK